jgi:hypothetical protein
VNSEARRAQLFPEPLAAKVPEITVLFWVVKLLTTCGGEAVSDYLALGNRQVGAVVEAGLLAVALVWQFRTRRYVAAAYWSLVYAIAIFGTGVSDALHLFIGIPYGGTTLLWAVVLALIFWAWYRSEGTLSIHSIVTRRRETFYWAVVFATFALGTALGDFTASVLGLGYLASAIVRRLLRPGPVAERGRLRLRTGRGDRGDHRRDPCRLPGHHPPRHPASGSSRQRPGGSGTGFRQSGAPRLVTEPWVGTEHGQD